MSSIQPVGTPELLVVLVDCSPTAWRRRDSQTGRKETIKRAEAFQSITAFCSMHALMHRENKLVVISNGEAGANIIFPVTPSGIIPSGITPTTTTVGGDGGSSHRAVLSLTPVAEQLPGILITGLLKDSEYAHNAGIDIERCGVGAGDSAGASFNSTLSHALSRALCIVNKQLIKHKHRLTARILVIQLQPDQNGSYNTIMNSIFR